MDLIPSSSILSWSHEVSLGSGNIECVGNIISSYLILTVASCVYGNGRTKLTIKTERGNEQNPNSKLEEEQIRNIGRIIFHPGFKNFSSENDLAILILDQELDTNLNSTAKIIPILDESTSTNFSGHFCKDDLSLSSLALSEPSRCSSLSSALQSDKLCLLPVKSKSSEANCKSPLPGSSLICSDAEHGQFLCGILSSSPEKMGENGQIYTNVTSHSKWIQSASAEAKLKPHAKVEESSDGDGPDADFDDHTEAPTIPVDPFVLNGKPSGPIPYQLSIRFHGHPPTGDWEHICGGVILDESTAITAAHCFVNTKDESRYRVVAGEDRLDTLDKKEQVLSVKKIIIHPDYTNYTFGNDIAVLHMEHLQLNKYAQVVWLSRFSAEELTSNKTVISGWGQVSNKGVVSNVLLQGSVSILPSQVCLKHVETRWKIPVQDGILCARNPDTRTCRGDSGGPLVIQNYTLGNSVGNLLVGITSFGAADCERRNTTGAFTEVRHFYDWIQENRAEKPCKENRLPCITGGCYLFDEKCDKEADCLDGTDELSCSEKPSAPCVGFINLDGEHELIYKVPSEERRRDSICVWIISTGRKDAKAYIEMTILDNPSAQFNPRFDIMFAQFNYSIDIGFYKTMSEIGQEYLVSGPFTAVYYRTNSSASNAGVHLKIRDYIPASNDTERLNVKLITIPNAGLKVGETREFSYPSSVSGASTYSSNERTFLILKPQKSGMKIKANLTFFDTEENYDWLEVGTYRVDRLFTARQSGRSGCKENFLEVQEDEPMVFYFHSDKAGERGGFKIEYSEILAPKPAACGGFIQLKGQQELLYKVPRELHGKNSVCMWVVATTEGSAIETYVYSNPRAFFQPPDSGLYTIFDFRIYDTTWKDILAKDKSDLIEQPFAVIYFRTISSASNSGFHIRLKEAGKMKTQKPVKYLELTASNSVQEFKYPPPPATNYTNDERSFVIVKPGSRHGELKLDMKSADTEPENGWMQIVSLAPTSEPIVPFRFNGEGSWSDKVFEAEEDEPFIFYFHSDKSDTRSGYQFSYSEKKKTTA